MFGFIKPNYKKLSDKEKLRYQEVYCGLCYSLRDNYGQIARLALTYDLTFLILFLSSLYEPKEKKQTCKCIFKNKKLKDANVALNKYSEYAADMTILLTYYKFFDDKVDKDHKIRGIIGEGLISKSFEKAKAKHPDSESAIKEIMNHIVSLENKDHPSADEISKLFGILLATVFCPNDDIWKTQLGKFGANLGRFIYFMDAALDLKKDKKNGCYNPYLEMSYKKSQIKDDLCILAGRMTQEFEKFPLFKDINIFENILYEGVWTSLNQNFSKKLKSRFRLRKSNSNI